MIKISCLTVSNKKRVVCRRNKMVQHIRRMFQIQIFFQMTVP